MYIILASCAWLAWRVEGKGRGRFSRGQRLGKPRESDGPLHICQLTSNQPHHRPAYGRAPPALAHTLSGRSKQPIVPYSFSTSGADFWLRHCPGRRRPRAERKKRHAGRASFSPCSPHCRREREGFFDVIRAPLSTAVRDGGEGRGGGSVSFSVPTANVGTGPRDPWETPCYSGDRAIMASPKGRHRAIPWALVPVLPCPARPGDVPSPCSSTGKQ